MKNLVVLTGAGISVESGLTTYRDLNGLWDNHRFEDVATLAGWRRDRHLVLNFYNTQRKRVLEAFPNKAHFDLVKLEKFFNVSVITQNVDDLHERAGSRNVTHLHGQITKSQSEVNSMLTYPILGWEMLETDKCIHGHSLRPHVVWFGEPVLNISYAKYLCRQADIFVVIGTSLKVMPAADLINYIPNDAVKYLIDPNNDYDMPGAIQINKKASVGVAEMLRSNIIINQARCSSRSI